MGRARLTLDLAPLDLAGPATETARTRALAAERGVGLVVDAERPAPIADRDRLVQLLILIDNAIDHSPAGGEVSVAVRRDGQATHDRGRPGPGIPEADRERIFEPFTRLPGSQGDRIAAAASGSRSGAASRQPTEARSRSTKRRGGARFTDLTARQAPGGG